MPLSAPFAPTLDKGLILNPSLPVSRRHGDTYIILDHESNYSNPQQGHQYRRIIVFVSRPQRFFFARGGECARQDKLLAVAAKISRVGFIKRYYEAQKWRMIVSPNFQNMVKKKLFGIPPEKSQNDGDRSNIFGKVPIISISKLITTDVSIDPVVDNYWDSYFDGK